VARPRLGSTGRIAADGTGSDMVVWLAVLFVSSNLPLCLRLGAERILSALFRMASPFFSYVRMGFKVLKSFKKHQKSHGTEVS